MVASPNYLILLIPFILALGFLGFATLFIVMTLRSRRQVDAAQAWTPTPGRVISATMREHTNYDSDNAPSTTYEPVVQYEYQVMGSPYQGSRIAFGATSFGHKQAAEMLARYTPGSPLTVYYNPNNPTDSVLERQAKGSVIFLIVGIVFALVGLAACCVGVALTFFMAVPQQ